MKGSAGIPGRWMTFDPQNSVKRFDLLFSISDAGKCIIGDLDTPTRINYELNLDASPSMSIFDVHYHSYEMNPFRRTKADEKYIERKWRNKAFKK